MLIHVDRQGLAFLVPVKGFSLSKGFPWNRISHEIEFSLEQDFIIINPIHIDPHGSGRIGPACPCQRISLGTGFHLKQDFPCHRISLGTGFSLEQDFI